MGRLIDAEKLEQELYQQWFMDILLTQTSSEDMFYALEQKIDEIPTAYDPDKVVEQLEKLLSDESFEKETKSVNESYYEGLLYAYGETIEIVKAGGTDGN